MKLRTTATKKRNGKKTPSAQDKKPDEQQKPGGNVEPIGPQYQLSAQEQIQWKTIKAKRELAQEKRDRAAAEDEMAGMLQQAWIGGIAQRLSIRGMDFTVNGDNGIVQVTGKRKKGKAK